MSIKLPAQTWVGIRGTLVVLWATLGLVVLLVNALLRLTPMAVEPIAAGGLSNAQVVVLALWVAFNAYAEGYRGFQLRFSPRFAARAVHLARHPRLLHVILAPLFCMGLLHATRRLLIVSWGLLFGIALLVWGVKHLDQPWRGIVDAGVVVGLAWGLVATLVYVGRGLTGRVLPSSPQVPDA